MRESLGGNLVLFRQGDAHDLAVVLTDLLMSPDRRREVGNRLREYARQEGIDQAVKRTLRYYRQTLRL